MKIGKGEKFIFDHNGCHLDFTLEGDAEKKAFVEILERAKEEVAQSIEEK